MKIDRIAIIGAGMAGLACARRLHTAGVAAELFDKASRAGGRMASRWLGLMGGTTLLDHGAQYFTARAPDFHALCTEALIAGVIAPWTGELRDERIGARAAHEEEARYRGNPDMNARCHAGWRTGFPSNVTQRSRDFIAVPLAGRWNLRGALQWVVSRQW